MAMGLLGCVAGEPTSRSPSPGTTTASVVEHDPAARPRIVLVKPTGDAHENPTLQLDDDGHVWVFCNTHGPAENSSIFRSVRPYDVDEFEQVARTNFSYSQPWFVPNEGFLFLHTRYQGGRRLLHWMTSRDGREWSEPRPLAQIAQGHYQVSNYDGVGRVATAAVVVLGILWIPVMKEVSGGGLYQYLQSVQGYLAPPITAVFLLGMFWSRMNSRGAVWALAGGFIIGMLKLTAQAFFGKGKIENPAFLAAVGDFNFLYATGVLFIISALLMIVGSLTSEAPPAEKTEGLTYRSIRALHGEEISRSWDLGNKLMATAIVVLVLGLYLYFSFWLD